MCHVPEGRGIFANLTVAENLELGALPAPSDTAASPPTANARSTLFPRLKERLSQNRRHALRRRAADARDRAAR